MNKNGMRDDTDLSPFRGDSEDISIDELKKETAQLKISKSREEKKYKKRKYELAKVIRSQNELISSICDDLEIMSSSNEQIIPKLQAMRKNSEVIPLISSLEHRNHELSKRLMRTQMEINDKRRQITKLRSLSESISQELQGISNGNEGLDASESASDQIEWANASTQRKILESHASHGIRAVGHINPRMRTMGRPICPAEGAECDFFAESTLL